MKKLWLLLSFLVPLNSFSQTFSGTTGPVPDLSTVCYTTSVSGVGTLTTTLGITSVCINLNHTWDGDLSISLISPSGTSVLLTQNNGGAGDNYTNTCFTMSAATNIASGTAPFTGSFLPQTGSSLATYTGENANGTWQLCITDGAGGDFGNLNSWTVTFGPVTYPPSFTIIDAQTAAALATDLVGSGVTISAPVLTCPQIGNGKFFGAPASLGIDSGIILTTGRSKTSGANYGANSSAFNFANTDNTGGTDVDLNAAVGVTSQDVCKLEFDFVPTGDTVKFRYVFASEEYPEWACTAYNDAFGFFISGPGIVGAPNIALLPGTATPVSINNVNNVGCGTATYYIDNSLSTQVTYDGTTTVFTALHSVTPCSTYHIKLVIGDVGDGLYDSGVFIEAGSLSTNSVTLSSTSATGLSGYATPTVIRGCLDGQVTFSIPAPLGAAYTVNYNVGGTATNGVDYTAIGTSAIIPAGSTSVSVNIHGLVAGPPTGPETVKIYLLSPYVCGVNSIIDSTQVTILDPATLSIVPSTASLCQGQSTFLTVTSSILNTNFTWSPSTGLTSTTTDTTTASPASTTDYIVTGNITGSGCPGSTDTIHVTVTPTPVVTASWNSPVCSGGTLNLTATPTTGYTYSWSGPGGFTSTSSTPSISPATPADNGTYTVTAFSGSCTSNPSSTAVVILPPVTGTQSTTICNGATYTWGGTTYSTGGTYTHVFTTTAGCDSTVTLTLTVSPAITGTASHTMCNGQTYTWGGTTYSTAGTFTHIFTAANGCDSTVTLTVILNPTYNTSFSASICPGQTYTFGGTTYSTTGSYPHTFTTTLGCDSIVTLNLTVTSLITSTATAAICNGLTYTWGGTTYSTGGTYTHLFTTSGGCDSQVTLTLVINPTYNTSFSATICNGATYSFGGTTYSSSGSYPHTFLTTLGCDSTVTLNLTVSPAITNSVSNTICNGATYTWGGTAYSTTGVYSHIFTAAGGCDSTVTLNLTVSPAITGTASHTMCNGQTYTWGGTTYSTAGTFSHIFTAANGCDSTVTLTVILNPTYNTSFSASICTGQTYTFGGTTYSASGSYPHTFTTTLGCDSIVTLNLTVSSLITGTASAAICNGLTYTWGGTTYSTGGTYTHLFTTSGGCDSQVTLTLVINPTYNTSFSATICNGATYSFGGTTYSSSGSYPHTFLTTLGCDSIVTLNLTVSPAITNSVSNTICSGTTYTWGGTTYSTTGVYSHIFTAASGCDSTVTLNLTVSPAITNSVSNTICNGTTYTWGGTTYSTTGVYSHIFTAASGCDSTVTLTLTVSPAITNSVSNAICSGTTYTWGGTTYSTTGVYSHIFTAANGCDSTVTLNLTVSPGITGVASHTMCNGQTYTWGGTTYSTGGTYTHLFTGAGGCDSTVTLTLVVNPTYNTSFAATICNGATYSFGGTTYSTSGSYPHTFTTTLGCDSIVTLNLTVSPAITNAVSATVCNGATYTWGGTTYASGGTYSHIFTAAGGCDSTVTLTLTVSPAITGVASFTMCNGLTYTWGGTTYSTAGTYSHIFTAANGCDSTVTLTLVVNPIYNTTLPVSICTGQTYTFGGTTYSATGSYPHTFTTIAGCDSIVTLNLTVSPMLTSTINTSICNGQTYVLGATSYTTAGTYTQLFTTGGGCDSQVTLNLVVNPTYNASFAATICNGASYSFGGTTYSTSGSYPHTFTTTVGCDSVVTLNLTVSPAITNSVSATVCNGATYTWGGTTYSATGTYSHIFTASNGCDSTVTLNLTVSPAITGTDSHTMCNGLTYTWGGTTYSTAGTYSHIFTAANGCDSTVTLTLIVNPTYNSTLTIGICTGQTYTFAGTTYSTTGTYPHTFTTAAGCDSVVTLDLTVSALITSTINTAICNGQTYVLGATSYTTAGTYTQLFTTGGGCDSQVTLNLVVNPTYNTSFAATICNGASYSFGGTAYSTSGSYPHTFTTTVGCDSIVTLNLTVSPAITNSVSATVCNGATYTWGGTTYSATGTYSQIFIASSGCDSTVTLSLTVSPAITGTDSYSMCNGLTYTWGGTTYSTAGTYSHIFTAANGCDSTVTLTLTVNPTYSSTLTIGICTGQTYTFAGTTYSTTGTYPYTFTTAAGCDSIVTLDLTVSGLITSTINTSICNGQTYVLGATSYTTAGTYTQLFATGGGCDSQVTLNLVVNPTYNNTLDVTICNGTSYSFGGASYAATGSYPVTFTTALGCDSIVTLNLTVDPPITNSVVATVCNGASYTWGSSTYSTTGTYSQVFIAANGCDSTVTLDLTVDPAITGTDTYTMCNGQTYTWGGTTYATAGTYTSLFTAANGCDSTVTLTLTVNPTYNSTLTVGICTGQTYTFAGTTYSTTGTYPYTFTTAAGCDSIVTLDLTVSSLLTSTIDATICDNATYTLGSTTYNVTGTYVQTFTTGGGCDSQVTLNLVVNPTYNSTLDVTICNGTTYSFGGTSYAATGSYPVTFTTTLGCDSIVTLNLTVDPPITNSFVATVCNGASYTWGSSTYSSTGTYSQIFIAANGCDSTVTLDLTVDPAITGTDTYTMCNGQTYIWGGTTYATAGTYTSLFTAANGCDSTVTLILTVNPTYNDTIPAMICTGSTYTFNGTTYSTTGLYSALFTSAAGCDSMVTLDLTVSSMLTSTVDATICDNATYTLGSTTYNVTGTYVQTFTTSGGCDSQVTLNLVVNPTYNSTLDVTICNGTTYSFGGTSYAASGSYPVTFTTALGCDSIVTLNLIVDPPIANSIVATVCDGASYTWGSTTYSSTGTYSQVFIAANGCDSTVTLDLTIDPAITATDTYTMCNGQTYTWGGTTYSTAGTYTNVFTAASGCDSTVTLTLNVNPSYSSTVTGVICSGQTYSFGGNTYNATGLYPVTFTTGTGCDSVVTLDLTVTPGVSTSITATICNGSSYVFNGSVITVGGTYVDSLTTAGGCDSVVTLTLNVVPVLTTNISGSFCQGSFYFFDGIPLAAAGNYADTLTSSGGCDSIVNLTLIMNPVYNQDINATLCDGQAYAFGGTYYTSTGTYVFPMTSSAGCDSTVNLHLIVLPPITTDIYDSICNGVSYSYNGASYTTTGDYVNVFPSVNSGCDSTVTLHLFVKPLPASPVVSDTTFCQGTTAAALSVAGTGIIWYATEFGPSAITAPVPPTTVPDTITYYVSQTVNGCESPRVPLVVTVLPKPLPVLVTTPVTYCSGKPSDSLHYSVLTTGYDSLIWYPAATGTVVIPEPVPSTATTGTVDYWVSQTVDGCVSNRTLVSVEVDTTLGAPAVVTPLEYCQYSYAPPLQATLSDTNAALLWYTAGSSIGSPVTPTPNTDTPGTTTWQVTQTLNGCESGASSITETTKPKPAPPVVNSLQTYCEGSQGGSVHLSATGVNLLWYTTAGGGTGTPVAPSVSTFTPDTVDWFVSQTINGCESDRAMISVHILAQPIAAISVDKDPSCQYDTLTFTFEGTAPAGSDYYWSLPGAEIISPVGGTNSAGPIVVRYNSGGTFTAGLVVDNHGCTSQAESLTLTVKPVPELEFALPDAGCIGIMQNIVLNFTTAGIDEPYFWNFDGGTIIFGQGGGPYGIVWNDTGWHTVIATVEVNGCRSLPFEDSIMIEPYPVADILTTPSKVCALDSITLMAEVAAPGETPYNYHWSPAEWIADSSMGPVAIIRANGTGWIHLVVETVPGCIAEDSVMVETEPCCTVQVPLAFTPNNDGRNDIFRVITIGNQQIKLFRVVNRWGQTVFETHDQNRGWDGTFNSVPQDMDTYYYIIQYSCTDGSDHEKQGDIILVR